jgi:hypothetical protein
MSARSRRSIRTLWLASVLSCSAWAGWPLVIQTDFGLRDGAVGSMKGVALRIDPRLSIHDLSHENTPYDIWEAAYRLKQSAPFWPKGTVFVSVVDPGVGTERKSIVLLTKSGHLFVGPDNGTFTLVADEQGILEVREIDEKRHRRKGSENSHTFHGRDVFAVVGAKLASGKIRLAEVGPRLLDSVVRLPYAKASRSGQVLSGTVPVLDYQYGNVWTNIPDTLLKAIPPAYGDTFAVEIRDGAKQVWNGRAPYARTFGDVPEGKPLVYLNSLGDLAIALNMGDFAKTHGIGYGANWNIRFELVAKR